jgi:hypothetical protein
VTEREKAIAICRRAVEHPLTCAYDTPEHAIALGFDVRLVHGEPGDVNAAYAGSDLPAVELAAHAWLTIDPEPLGIKSAHDPRREEAAAKLLEEGWSP